MLLQADLENKILDIIEHRDDFTFSDLQGAIQAQVMIFTSDIKKLK